MKKIILATISVLTIASVAQATESFSGAYAGVQVGLSSTRTEGETVSVQDATSKTIDGGNNFSGSLLVGYGQTFDSLYAGVEARIGMLTGTTKTFESGAYIHSNTPRESYVAAGRVGYLLTQKAMVFLSLGAGMENTSYKFQYGSKSTESKKRDLVFVPGIGTEIAVSESLNFRADFNFTMGKKRTFSESDLSAAGTSLKSASFKPIRSAFMLGLSYRF
jgi:opacity protein-like surface antigen